MKTFSKIYKSMSKYPKSKKYFKTVQFKQTKNLKNTKLAIEKKHLNINRNKPIVLFKNLK